MYYSGNGITGLKALNVEPYFRSEVTYALKWVQCASGKWVATDRGAASDVYQCRVTIRGYESYINEILQDIEANRVASSGNMIVLSHALETEKIFGEDVVHNTVNTTVIDIGEREQYALRSFRVALTLQAISPTFIGAAAANVTFRNLDYEYKSYSQYTINKVDTYTGAFSYQDRRADTGVIEGTAYLTLADMVTFRRTLATQRGAAITTTVMSGIGYPMGPNRDTTWPKNLKYLEVKDLGYFGVNRHRVYIKAVEDI